MTGPPGPCGCSCALTPDTSIGFHQADFAAGMMRHPFDPWQRWSVIHAGELLPDGTLRFRFVLIIVARQNGKTEIVAVLAPYWIFVDRVKQILGTSTKLPMAEKTWAKSRDLIIESGLDELLEQPGRRGKWYREGNGKVEIYAPKRTAPTDEYPKGKPWGSSYIIDVAAEDGGRSLSCERLILDELRHHYDYSAWGASVRTMGAQDEAQAWLLSNAGSTRSVVLNEQRAAALAAIGVDEDGTRIGPGDPSTNMFIAEWSTERSANPLDLVALAQANPNMNRRGQRSADLLADARRAIAAGGEALTELKTEVMCINVRQLKPAIDPGAWSRCLDVGDLSRARSRIALFLDIAPDQQHATLMAAAVLRDDRVRIEAIAAWSGVGCVEALKRALPGHVARVKPQALGWLPGGPAAALASFLKPVEGRPSPFPPGVTVEEIRGEAPAVCMGFDREVTAGTVVHSDDPLINDHVTGAERLKRGDTWVFMRTGEGHCDAAYAAAGAVHLARTLPAPIGKPRLVVAPSDDDE